MQLIYLHEKVKAHAEIMQIKMDGQCKCDCHNTNKLKQISDYQLTIHLIKWL